MKYPEFEHTPKISIADFRPNMADVIEVMEESGKPVVLTRRGVPVMLMQPVSLRAYRNMKKGITAELAKNQAAGDLEGIHQLSFLLKGVKGKIAQLTDNSKNLKKAQSGIRQMLIDSMPQYQQFLFSSEDSAMLESNTSADEAEADKQSGRKARPAKSVTKVQFRNTIAATSTLGVQEITSAESVKLPLRSSGIASKGSVKR